MADRDNNGTAEATARTHRLGGHGTRPAADHRMVFQAIDDSAGIGTGNAFQRTPSAEQSAPSIALHTRHAERRRFDQATFTFKTPATVTFTAAAVGFQDSASSRPTGMRVLRRISRHVDHAESQLRSLPGYNDGCRHRQPSSSNITLPREVARARFDRRDDSHGTTTGFGTGHWRTPSTLSPQVPLTPEPTPSPRPPQARSDRQAQRLDRPCSAPSRPATRRRASSRSNFGFHVNANIFGSSNVDVRSDNVDRLSPTSRSKRPCLEPGWFATIARHGRCSLRRRRSSRYKLRCEIQHDAAIAAFGLERLTCATLVRPDI